MRPFETAWSILKADNKKCPGCGMKQSACMQKMGCGSMQKGIFDSTDRGYYNDPQQNVSEEDQNAQRAEEDADFEGMMSDEDGRIGPNYQPRTEDEHAALSYFQDKYSSSDPETHQSLQELAQEYFVEHMNEMQAKKTGISPQGMDKIDAGQGMGGKVAVKPTYPVRGRED